ncbi:MAG: hypothetical protein E4H36_02250 [Spirochaetales bacterium]|nr:MAG: hypothetical protein E4H36_02250 [Spirochaetales bacterium]
MKKNILNREEFPLLLTVLPLMKGVPSKAAAESIRIRVFPVVADLGVLFLSLTYQENTKASAVLLNGKEISLTAAPILLPSGIHQLSVVMPEGYRKDINLVMEKGKKTQLQVYVENPLAQVFINLPSAGNFFLDGEKMDVVPAKSLNLTPGRHTVTMKIGDYSISKNFSVSSGKTYTISLIMDMDIKEKEEKK